MNYFKKLFMKSYNPSRNSRFKEFTKNKYKIKNENILFRIKNENILFRKKITQKCSRLKCKSLFIV